MLSNYSTTVSATEMEFEMFGFPLKTEKHMSRGNFFTEPGYNDKNIHNKRKTHYIFQKFHRFFV